MPSSLLSGWTPRRTEPVEPIIGKSIYVGSGHVDASVVGGDVSLVNGLDVGQSTPQGAHLDANIVPQTVTGTPQIALPVRHQPCDLRIRGLQRLLDRGLARNQVRHVVSQQQA